MALYKYFAIKQTRLVTETVPFGNFIRAHAPNKQEQAGTTTSNSNNNNNNFTKCTARQELQLQPLQGCAQGGRKRVSRPEIHGKKRKVDDDDDDDASSNP